jgi:hypothetical protein
LFLETINTQLPFVLVVMSNNVSFPTEPPFGPVLNGTQIIVFYHYNPNKHAAYVFMALFALCLIGHLVYLFRLRAWYFTPLLIGGVGKPAHPPAAVFLPTTYWRSALTPAEVAGYYGRAWSSTNPNKLGPWILQNFLLLSAAPLIAATIYMTLSRLVTALGAGEHSLIRPSWISKIYVLADIACLGSQIAGTVLPASGDETVIQTSRNVVLGGLVAQIIALGFFVFMTWHARRRIGREKVRVLLDDPAINWESQFRVLEAATALVMLRSIVRGVEYAQGESGFVVRHEVFIYVFDAAAMVLVMGAFLVLHPSRLVRDALGVRGRLRLPECSVELDTTWTVPRWRRPGLSLGCTARKEGWRVLEVLYAYSY